MATKLAVYKAVARLLGQASGVASLTETSELRLTLDDAWDNSVSHLLAQGFWNFAIRESSLTKDGAYTATFGYDYRYAHPSDWVRTVAISDTGDFNTGFERFLDQAGYWYTDVDPLYLRYVSDDASYGTDLTAWSEPFAKALEAYLAFECSLLVSGGSKSLQSDNWSLFKNRLKDAKTLDAVDEAVKYRPAGRLVKARLASSNSKDG